MACKKCDFKGYIEVAMMRDAGAKKMVRMCTECRDVSAYSRYVQSIYAVAPAKERAAVSADVLELPRRPLATE